MRAGAELLETDAAGFRAELDAVVAVYAAAMNASPLMLPARRATMEHHTGLPGFRAIIVLSAPGTGPPGRPGGTAAGGTPDGGTPHGRTSAGDAAAPVIAFTYGFHGEPGQWWHDLVTEALAETAGEEVTASWLTDAFEVAEVHVHPDHQRRGIGREMMVRLLRPRRERTAVLSTMDAGTPARRMYRQLGFTDLLTGYRFTGTDPPYAVMGARLPLRAAVPPAG